MRQPECEHLDDYLLGWLVADEAAAFERHLADCEQCRAERQLQQSIDRLLAEQGKTIDAPSAGFALRIERRAQAARRRSLLRLASFAAAAAASIAVIAVVGIPKGGMSKGTVPFLSDKNWDSPKADNRDSPLVAQSPLQTESSVDVATNDSKRMPYEELTLSTRVRLTDPSAGIVVDCKTRNPDITMVWIYPTPKFSATENEPINQ